jgi:3-dehydroquinate synthase
VGRVNVEIPGRAYPVLVGQGALQELPLLLKRMGASGTAVISERTVAQHWGEPVLEALSGLGLRAALYAAPPGEEAKSLSELGRVVEALEDAGLDRQGVVVALGGGTVGDLAGFAAAVWLRGVRCVQVPTTLLSMVDSSVGGKTGVNTARTKNAVGAFWQPAAVVSDLSLLSTLPEDEYLAAFGEIVKYAVAMDADLARRLRAEAVRLREREPEALEAVVTRCVELKAAVVAADEREAGPRAVLNYGHTVGHAVEAASGYRAVHGRAVALGLRAAAGIAADVGLCDEAVVAAQTELLEAFQLPGPLPAVSAADVLAAIPRDKKRRGGKVRWVLPRELGRAQIGVEVPEEVVAGVVCSLLPTAQTRGGAGWGG